MKTLEKVLIIAIVCLAFLSVYEVFAQGLDAGNTVYNKEIFKESR